MTATSDRYDLLPSVYRIRDAEREGTLEALASVLAAEADVVDRDVFERREHLDDAVEHPRDGAGTLIDLLARLADGQVALAAGDLGLGA